MPRRNNATTENRRVKYSKKLIQDSLLQLLQEKPLEKITVKELCERADVNRGTFYRYYEDIFDLFETIEQALATDFEKHTETIHTQGMVPFLTELLLGAEKNRDLVIILSNDRGDDSFFRKCIDRLYELLSPQWKEFISCTEEEMKILYTIAASSMEAITFEWLKGNIDMTAEELAQLYYNIFMDGSRQFLLNPGAGR